MRKHAIIILFSLMPFIAQAQEIIYEKSDSTRIEEILERHSCRKYSSKGELVLAIADEFTGTVYVGHTLENGKEEPLFISCTRLDCSTFVELVTAIARTIDKGESGFAAVCSNLEKIRYRGGIRDGYASRLHYTSWWIDDNIEKGIIREVTALSPHKSRELHINFMSTNSSKYEMLRNDPAMTARIEELEVPYRGIETDYIAKEMLDKGQEELLIEDGDIIALVTTVEGLDIAHVGFAFWQDGKLHLMHASSAAKRVIKDTKTLHEYQKNKKSQIGIRALRIE